MFPSERKVVFRDLQWAGKCLPVKNAHWTLAFTNNIEKTSITVAHDQRQVCPDTCSQSRNHNILGPQTGAGDKLWIMCAGRRVMSACAGYTALQLTRHFAAVIAKKLFHNLPANMSNGRVEIPKHVIMSHASFTPASFIATKAAHLNPAPKTVPVGYHNRLFSWTPK